jgi:single-strand DNA-binding protein
MNKTFLCGNLGKDPELKYTQSGYPMVNLSLATKDRRKNNQDQWVDETDWHRVVIGGKQAENAAKYLKKGREVTIVGKLKTRKYVDNNNIERWVTEVKAVEIYYHNTSQQSSGQPSQGYQQRANHNQNNYAPNARGQSNGGVENNNMGFSGEGADAASDIPF